MRAWKCLVALLMVLAAFAGGCGQRTELAEDQSADSLLAANPTEQAPGDITPQTEYQEPEPTSPPARAPASKPRSKPRPTTRPSEPAPERGVRIPAGTPITLTVDAKISSETAQPGDTWTGTVKEAVVVGSEAPIPAGSMVSGVVTGARGAQRGDRAFLVLSVTSVTANGRKHSVHATTDSIIAGSTRARNLGAIAGGAAAGALIGKAVGGSGKGALIGGLIGGAAATGAVAKSKGYQVELKEGTELTFTTSELVVVAD